MLQICRLLSSILIFGLLSLQFDAVAQSGTDLVQQQCAACHALSPTTLTTEGRMSQKGPALYYAGIKYRPGWMEAWLQNPVTIRPGGMFSGNHTSVTDDGDEINTDSLIQHISLSAEEAARATDYLVKLTAKSELILSGEYEPKTVSQRMGAMNFRKFKGCSSCHQDQPDIGGVSGPELYTAYDRLNADFIVSYIRNPVAWDGVSLMPHAELKDKAIFKLVNYLKLISGEKQ